MIGETEQRKLNSFLRKENDDLFRGFEDGKSNNNGLNIKDVKNVDIITVKYLENIIQEDKWVCDFLRFH
jgi:hypothetical protein